MRFYLVLVPAIAGFAAVFVIQNAAAVDVNFLFWTVSMSRALLILFTLATGFVLGWILHGYYAFRRKP